MMTSPSEQLLNSGLPGFSRSDNQPLSEQFRLTAKAWVEADEAASLMEECKSSTYSQMMMNMLEGSPNLSVNRLEMAAKSSLEYKEFITQMVKLRSKANLLKIKMEWLRMRFQENMSKEATARTEARL